MIRDRTWIVFIAFTFVIFTWRSPNRSRPFPDPDRCAVFLNPLGVRPHGARRVNEHKLSSSSTRSEFVTMSNTRPRRLADAPSFFGAFDFASHCSKKPTVIAVPTTNTPDVTIISRSTCVVFRNDHRTFRLSNKLTSIRRPFKRNNNCNQPFDDWKIN